MKNVFKSVFLTFAILIVVLVVGIFGFVWLVRPETVTIGLALSPDSALLARKTQIGKKDSDSSSIQILVENKNQIFSAPETLGYVYRYDNSSCRFDVELKWGFNDTLIVYYPDTATVALDKYTAKLGGRTVSTDLVPIPRSQWYKVSDIELPPCSSPVLKTPNWETPLE